MKKFILLLAFTLFYFLQVNAQDAKWLRYPAISQDGQNIVFSYQGDLFKVSADGGRAIQLTTHSAYDFMPVISKDGKKIAFASDRHGNFDVFTMSIDGGQATRLTFHSSNDYPSCFTNEGAEVLYTSSRRNSQVASVFPSGVMSELYKVSVNGGRENQLLTTPAVNAKFDASGENLIYEDVKGYENQWRKRHTSSVTRDIFIYNVASGKHTKVSNFEGEDRSPVWGSDNSFYYLSEANGAFNIWKGFQDGRAPVEMTFFENHPVRFLSISDGGLMCFSWDGDLYTFKEGEEPMKLAIQIFKDNVEMATEIVSVSSGATEMALSPNEKEVAFVYRGEIFVTSIDHSTTKRITNTPEEERNISFSPDGKSILFASERDGVWGIYEVSLTREEEKYFHMSTTLKEDILVKTDKDSFQPKYSPDGKEVAFLETRVNLKVLNKKSKETRLIMDEKFNFSYSDGDQYYDWSPDGKWFLVHYQGSGSMMTEVGLIASDGKSSIVNLTKSGYSDNIPKWTGKGDMLIWFTDRNGFRSHGSWGSQYDAYAMFLNKASHDKFKLRKEELDIYKEILKETEEKAKSEEEDDSKDKKKKKSKDEEKVDPIVINLEGIEDRVERLSVHSSNMADAVMSKDGETLFYLANFEKGYDLWVQKIYDKETKLLAKLSKGGGELHLDKEGKNIYLLASGQILKISTDKGEVKTIGFNSEMEWKPMEEREYIFEHAWRQFRDKFYIEDIHGIDWDFYKAEYAKFLPYINNNWDFTEMLSEMLGEANASHTGSGYRKNDPNGDMTATLGLFFDENHEGKGLKISEVIDKSPVLKDGTEIAEGVIIEKIDGIEIDSTTNYYQLLNRKVDKLVLLSLYQPGKNKRWEEVVRPISMGQENRLLYERWVKQRRAIVDSLSNGQLGYVHVSGMNSNSFREVYSEVLGRYHDKKALIVDTRFNGGGWLHDDLATFLSGKQYLTFSPRGNEILGGDPISKWTKPSCVLVSESNYSDAHMFPYVYQTLGIGKVIGMPVPGTGTAVWWETQIDPTIYFGIPQLGIKDINGNYLENQQLDPDIEVWNDYESLSKGGDLQLERAIQEMLGQ